MDIINLLIGLASGAVGGNLAGAAMKDKTLGTVGNSIAGIIGGAGGNFILQALGILSTTGVTEMSLGSIMTNVASSGVGGAVLMAIIGAVKSAMKKN